MHFAKKKKNRQQKTPQQPGHLEVHSFSHHYRAELRKPVSA